MQDDTQLRQLRFSMAGLLRRTLDSIVIHNHFPILPWEATGVISDKLRDDVFKLPRIKSEQDLENYFSTAIGKRKYVESERHFIIRFKSGAKRVVYPYQEGTFISTFRK